MVVVVVIAAAAAAVLVQVLGGGGGGLAVALARVVTAEAVALIIKLQVSLVAEHSKNKREV